MEHLPFFVYGTLKHGERNDSIWPFRPNDRKPAKIFGTLYDLGPYPCLLQGDDTIRGELWFINDHIEFRSSMAALDALEGYGQGGEDLYLRRIVECITECGTHSAYTYYYNQPLTGHYQRILPDPDGVVSWTGRGRR